MKNKLIFTLLTTIAFTSFAMDIDIEDQIKAEIDKNHSQITKQYFENYALNNADKNKNIQLLAKKYISKKNISNKDYVQEFTYEAEKQGFANFLRNHGKECSKIEEGPLYKTDVAAYEVKCINHVYYMTFDQTTKTWNLIENIK